MEMMRVRILVYMFALISFNVQTHTASVNESSEQTALQETLLLVELLKSEYSKLLREKSLIKAKDVDEKDLQTCPTTTASPDAVTHTNTDNPIRHIEREESSTTLSLKPYTAAGSSPSYQHSYRPSRNLRHDRRSPQAGNPYYYDFPRRRYNNYRDYYGSYGPEKSLRRMDYENIFGPQPGQTIPTSTVSQSTPVPIINSPINATFTTISTTASSKASEMSTSSILSHTSNSSTIDLSTTVSSTTPKSVTVSVTTLKPTDISIPIILSSTLTTLLNIKQPTLISKRASNLLTASNTQKNNKTPTKHLEVSEKVKHKRQKLLLSVKQTTVTFIDEPEQAQVAAELENELEAAIEPSSSLPSSSSHRWSMTWRPTTRVHLAKSTPYHLPLPENHAFCYTNPKSSLCRTFIK